MLRDRNYSLQDENLKLKEGREVTRTADFRSRELMRESTGRNPLSSSVRSGELTLGSRPGFGCEMMAGVSKITFTILFGDTGKFSYGKSRSLFTRKASCDRVELPSFLINFSNVADIFI